MGAYTCTHKARIIDCVYFQANTYEYIFVSSKPEGMFLSNLLFLNPLRFFIKTLLSSLLFLDPLRFF